jgi:hypothetical protein
VNDTLDLLDFLFAETGYPRFNKLMTPRGRSAPAFVPLTLTPGHLEYPSGLAARLPYLHPEGTQDEVKEVRPYTPYPEKI